MSHRPIFGFRLGHLVACAGACLVAASFGSAQAPSAATRTSAAAFTVDADVALHSFMSLGDMHMRKLADVLTVLAATGAARSANWARVRPVLAAAGAVNVPAVLWFAHPDGGYWTLAQGRVPTSLADRPYFRRVLAGRIVVGDLVVSRSTGRNTAIVAVPVRGRDGAIVGVLGGSVYLDSLSTLIRREMGGLHERLLFFAIDSQPLGALHSDSTLIFTEPMKLGDDAMRSAFAQMLAGSEGVVTYTFRGVRRTLLYHRSRVTGWWYAFGEIQKPASVSTNPVGAR